MELKFYLRGLGIGIVVAAIVMGVALSKKKTMTDEEVKARAKELGMIENTVLSEDKTSDKELNVSFDVKEDKEEDNEGDNEEVVEPIPSLSVDDKDTVPDEIPVTTIDETTFASTPATEVNPPSEDDSSEDDAQSEDNSVAKDDSSEEDNSSKEEPKPKEDTSKEPESSSNEKPNSGTISFTVNTGESSYTIAQHLVSAGLVNSASEYDTYLCNNGYDRYLKIGTYSIPSDATQDQIAKILTGK